jgi:exodeoxyribonuclease V gamma subunit
MPRLPAPTLVLPIDQGQLSVSRPRPACLAGYQPETAQAARTATHPVAPPAAGPALTAATGAPATVAPAGQDNAANLPMFWVTRTPLGVTLPRAGRPCRHQGGGSARVWCRRGRDLGGDRVLTVHRSVSGTVLALALADVLRVAPEDPFAPEVVAVPAKGVERWLAQRLAQVLGAEDGDGVCANVRFPWPSTLTDDAVQSASPAHAASVERWAPDRATWAVLDVLDAHLSEPWASTLARHLSGRGAVDGRRFAVASRLAKAFDAYGQARPAMLRAWAGGRDETGDGTPLPDDVRWQAQLWRLLSDRLGSSPAELLDDSCDRLRADPSIADLPARLSVFGASRLSFARLQVLAALAEHRDVHLWLHHPSPALWDRAAAAGDVVRRADDPTTRELRNPLLASMARDLVELQHLLRRCTPGATDVLHPSPAPPSTLLGRLKTDLAEDAVHGNASPLDPGDGSVQVHACHGRTRQVEVLREVVLGLLAADRTLEPRDVLVMCPDVEAFAPLVAAAFSLGAEGDGTHPASRLRVRIADRALRQTNPLIDVLSLLLELGTARLTAPEVLDLASRSAVRQRFGFDDDALERLRSWVVAAGVRWGLHPGHRETWKLGGVPQGTWREGLDRLLLGVTVEGESTEFGDVLPVDDVDSADIELLGRFAELVDRLDAAQELMTGTRTPGEWADGLLDAVLSLAGTSPREAWQQAQLAAELAEVADAADGSDVRTTLADVRGALEESLAGRPTRASFRTGTLTVCTLVPMRSVPHRVVCLVGLDDGAFPRQSLRDGDDVLVRNPWVGERDPRSEDRQLLLDAVLAAGEHLVITYTGADERTGAEVVPAVPLGELLDALDRTASTTDGQPVRDAITTRHPLQPFDPRNFEVGVLAAARPFSFDPVALSGARAAAGERRPAPPFLAGPLTSFTPRDVELAELHRLLQHPARGFLRQRLDVASAWVEQEPDDALPVELDSLQEWAIGDRVLRRLLDGMPPGRIVDLERHAGTLPPGPLAAAVMAQVGGKAEAIARACATELLDEPESYDVDVALCDGTRLTGTVTGVRGDVVLLTTYSSLGPKHRLQAWVDLVALSAAHPGRQWRAVAVGRKGSRARRSTLQLVTPEDALPAVEDLVALYRNGLRAPLPLPLKTAAEYASRRDRGDSRELAVEGATKEWLGSKFPGEQADAEHRLLLGEAAPLAALTAEAPWDDEGWYPDEVARFGQLSRRLWERLLAVEVVS